jgi:phage shock protein C
VERRFYKSSSDKMLSGVCGGIAEYFSIDPTIVRLLAVIGAVASFGTALVVYIVLAIVIPENRI